MAQGAPPLGLHAPRLLPHRLAPWRLRASGFPPGLRQAPPGMDALAILLRCGPTGPHFEKPSWWEPMTYQPKPPSSPLVTPLRPQNKALS